MNSRLQVVGIKGGDAVQLIVASSGSQGNCYILKDDYEYLIIEAGVPLKAILPLIDFQISKVSGVIVSHFHADHDKYSKDWINRGIPVVRPFDETQKIPQFKRSCYKIQFFPLQDSNGKWVHSNGDGSECKVYGYLISHPRHGILVYASDMEFIKWKFSGVDNFLIEANYDLDELENDGEVKSKHIFNGHHSIQAACKFIQANQNANDIKNVILCHLSSQNGSPDDFKKKMEEVTGEKTRVYIAKKGLKVEL